MRRSSTPGGYLIEDHESTVSDPAGSLVVSCGGTMSKTTIYALLRIELHRKADSDDEIQRKRRLIYQALDHETGGLWTKAGSGTHEPDSPSGTWTFEGTDDSGLLQLSVQRAVERAGMPADRYDAILLVSTQRWVVFPKQA